MQILIERVMKGRIYNDKLIEPDDKMLPTDLRETYDFYQTIGAHIRIDSLPSSVIFLP